MLLLNTAQESTKKILLGIRDFRLLIKLSEEILKVKFSLL